MIEKRERERQRERDRERERERTVSFRIQASFPGIELTTGEKYVYHHFWREMTMSRIRKISKIKHQFKVKDIYTDF